MTFHTQHRHAYWALNSLTSSDLEKSLTGPFNLRIESTAKRTLVLLDDFDWHIWHSDRLLLFEPSNNAISLVNQIPNKAKQHRTKIRRNTVKFWWELPAGKLQDLLKTLTGFSAVTPKCQFTITSRNIALLNSDKKTVARLQENGIGKTTQISLESLIGYESQFDAAKAIINAQNSTPLPKDSLKRLLSDSGLASPEPEVFELAIDPEATAESAVLTMAEQMLAKARRYEQGILEDIDTEFLHQYRVHLRKARSLLKLFKGVFPSDRYQHLQTTLGSLCKVSNELRDIDVFLLNRENLCALLDAEQQPGLKAFFSYLSRHRDRELKKVTGSLSSEQYSVTIRQLLHELSQEPQLLTKQSGQEIKSLVSRKILKQYDKICKDSGNITRESKAESIHALRIECKKLRYLMEVFSGFYPDRRHEKLVNQLKKLQDNLGLFNDYSVQQAYLYKVAQQRKSQAEQVASLNELIKVLFNKQEEQRIPLEKNIGRLISTSSKTQFKALFSLTKQGSVRK